MSPQTSQTLHEIANAEQVFKAQPGGQELFLSSPADVVFYGGQAGGGKTYALLLDPLRYYRIKGFNCTIFRRQLTEIKTQGGLWDESNKIYPHFGGKANISDLKWTFESGASIEFAAMAVESDIYNWKGAQICALHFDEITGFTKKQFDYLLTRNRSLCGVKSYVRATCNPDPTHFVFKFVEWYLLPEGIPDPMRRGIIRYYATPEGADEYVFGDSVEYLCEKYDLKPIDCTSYTFIYGTLEDNPALLAQDPQYITKLRSNPIEYARLAKGNWKVVASGKMFDEEDFRHFYVTPSEVDRKIITIDTASKKEERHDFSVMQCWVQNRKGIYLIDQVRGKFEINELTILARSFITKHKRSDSPLQGVYVEDKSAGTQLIQIIRRETLAPIFAVQRSKDKYTRAYDCQGYVQSGYVWLNDDHEYYPAFISELVAFCGDGKGHDDQVDCMLDAIQLLLIDNPNSAINGDESFDPYDIDVRMAI